MAVDGGHKGGAAGIMSRIRSMFGLVKAKGIDLATDLVPIAEFRSSTARILDDMTDEGRTLVITQNGKAKAVVMSPWTPSPRHASSTR